MSHGPECGGRRSDPFKCQCGRYVVWYTCNHGSRVLFNDTGKRKLGSKHECYVYQEYLRNKPVAVQERWAVLKEVPKSTRPDIFQIVGDIRVDGKITNIEDVTPNMLYLMDQALSGEEYDYVIRTFCNNTRRVSIHTLEGDIKVIIGKLDRPLYIGSVFFGRTLRLRIKSGDEFLYFSPNI